MGIAMEHWDRYGVHSHPRALEIFWREAGDYD